MIPPVPEERTESLPYHGSSPRISSLLPSLNIAMCLNTVRLFSMCPFLPSPFSFSALLPQSRLKFLEYSKAYVALRRVARSWPDRGERHLELIGTQIGVAERLRIISIEPMMWRKSI